MDVYESSASLPTTQHSTLRQAVVLAERLVGRLRRLDEVLPRYQGVASELFELLRVHSLDEVVPAVRGLVGRGARI